MSTAAEYWRRGNEAISRENWDYAIEMYSMAVRMAPDNFLFRQSLRFTEYKKHGNGRRGPDRTSPELALIRTRVERHRSRGEWKMMDDACEEGLAISPWDAQLHADLRDATNELGYRDVAKFAYQESLKSDPANRAVNRSLALLLELGKEYAEAITCWQRILKNDPGNREAFGKIRSLKALDDPFSFP